MRYLRHWGWSKEWILQQLPKVNAQINPFLWFFLTPAALETRGRRGLLKLLLVIVVSTGPFAINQVFDVIMEVVQK